MSDSRELIRLMESVGFTPEASRVYGYLLVGSPLSPEALAISTRTNREVLQKHLARLLSLHLIGMDQNGRSKQYYATDPSHSWMAVEADLVWRRTTTLRKLDSLPQTDDPGTEGLREICEMIQAAAVTLYRPFLPVREHKERDAATTDEFARMICEAIQTASTSICAVSKSPRLPQLSSFWSVLTNRIEGGVSYRRVADMDEVIAHGLGIVERDREVYGIDLRILERDRITRKFYLVDNAFLAIFHEDSASSEGGRHGIGRLTNQKAIIRRYKERFKKLYDDAIPSPCVVGQLRDASLRLRRRAEGTLQRREVGWLMDRVEFGKFSRYSEQEGITKEEEAKIIVSCLATGMLLKNPYGELVPLYDMDEKAIRVECGL